MIGQNNDFRGEIIWNLRGQEIFAEDHKQNLRGRTDIELAKIGNPDNLHFETSNSRWLIYWAIVFGFWDLLSSSRVSNVQSRSKTLQSGIVE